MSALEMPKKKPMSRYSSYATMPCWVSLLGNRIEDGLAHIGIIGRANTAAAGAGVVSERGPEDIRISGMNAALNVESAGMTVTDGRIAGAGGESLLDGGCEARLAACKSERASALGSVLTGGGGFGFGLGGSHEGGGGGDVVFHNDARLIPTLGYVKEFLSFLFRRDSGPPTFDVLLRERLEGL